MKKTVTKTKKETKPKKEKKPKEVVEDRTPTTLEVWDEEGHKTTYKIDYEGHII